MKTVLKVLVAIFVMTSLISISTMVFADILTDTANVKIGTTYNLPATIGGKLVDWGNQSTTVDISKQGRQIFTGTTDTGTATFTLNVGVAGVEAPVFQDNINYTTGTKPAAIPGLSVVSSDTATAIVTETGNETNKVVQLGTGQTGWSSMKYTSANTGLTGTNVTVKARVKFNQLISTGTVNSGMPVLSIQLKNSADVMISDFYFYIFTDASGAYNFTKGLNLRGRWYTGPTGTATTQTSPTVIPGVTISSAGSSWMNLKAVLDTTSKTYSVYINDDLVLSNINFNTKNITDDTTLMNLKAFAFADRNTGASAQDTMYVDDIGFYTGAVQPTVYFNGTDFPTGLSTSVDQNTTTKPFLSATLGLSNSTTRAMPISWTLPNTSKVGKFVTNGYIEGFNTPIPITVDIVKPITIINQDMEGYTVGTALNTLPWHISNPGVVALESGTQNKVLDCTATRNFNTISTTGNINGKIKIDYKVKFTGTDFTTFSMGAQNVTGYALAELTFANNGSGLFKLSATTRLASAPTVDTYPVLVAYGGINVGDWINMSIVLDTDAKTYDVYYNGDKVGTAIGFRYQYETSLAGASDPYLNKFSVADRTSSVSSTLHYYIDNIYITRYLQVSSVKTTTLDVVLNDTAVLPQTVTATLTDLTTTQLMDVTWNSGPNVSQVGVYNITGAVTGFDTPATLIVNVTQYPYVIDSLGFSNSSGQTVLGLTQDGNLDTIKLQKLSSQNYDGVIYVALYENNAIVGIKAIEVLASMDWNKGESKEFVVNKLLDKANVENCTAKAFFFGGSIQPYSMPIVINNSTPPASPLKIYICGDSTAATYTEAQAPLTGWGQVFGSLFDASKATVDNRAMPGRSSMSFINEGRLSDILSTIQKGDYLLIQFGHNDERTTEPLVGTDPQTTYKYYLTQYIEGARAKGAIPVLLTPTERAWYTGTNLTRTHIPYQTAMKELALSLKVPLIDITDKCYSFLNPLGEATATTYYMMGATNDRTHFNVSGANLMAGFVAQGIQELKLPIANLLN